MYSLHIVGVIFALFGKHLQYEEAVIDIAEKSIEECFKILNDSENTNAGSVKSQLAFFFHGALSLVAENLTEKQDRSSVHTWTKLMLLYRSNKVFSDQNIREPKFRNTTIYFEHFRERAIFNNIRNVKEYFIKHPEELTSLISLIDKGIN